MRGLSPETEMALAWPSIRDDELDSEESETSEMTDFDS